MIRTETTNIAGPMNKGEAKALTERIRNAVDGLGALVEQAHDRGAWKALGYATWEAYVKTEFGFTRQRSYQLLDQGRVAKEIASAAGTLSNAFDISARDVAAVKADLPAVKAEIKAKVEKGEDPKKAVAETVSAARAEKEKARAERKPMPPSKPAAVDVDALQAELEELREERDALRADVERLTAENKKFAELKMEYDRGGFEAILANRDETIRVLQSRVASESAEKVKNLRDLRAMGRRLDEAGAGKDIYIDVDRSPRHG